jgi:hypothetical protein
VPMNQRRSVPQVRCPMGVALNSDVRSVAVTEA